MKLKNILWVLALMYIVSCSSSGDVVEPTPEPLPDFPEEVNNLQKYAKDDEVKVMSFNVRLNSVEDGVNAWPYRKDAAIEMIKDHKPTLIGFQEAKYSDQWLFLKSALQNDYDGWGLNRDNGKESGNGEVMGILYDKSKVKKLDGGTFWLSTTPDKVSKSWGSACYRTATWGVFEHIHTGKKFCYINTHLDHLSADAQVEGMRVIVNKFKEYNPDGYVELLSGDFNVTYDNVALEVLKDYMVNTRTAAPKGKTDSDRTTNGFKTSGGSIIDHVYCTKGMEVVEYHTINENYGVTYISDHYPIYAIVSLR